MSEQLLFEQLTASKRRIKRIERANTVSSLRVTDNDILQRRALLFDGTKAHHVNHRLVHLPDTEYGAFYTDAIFNPTGSGYIYSAGYGGNHCLLWGVTGNSTLGYSITGNIHNSETGLTTSFVTNETVPHGEDCHASVAFDGTDRITISIKGVPASVTAREEPRKTTSPFDGVGFIAGSDHNNFSGLIYRFRLFETILPYTAAQLYQNAIRPQIDGAGETCYNGTVLANAVLAIDYRSGQTYNYGAGLEGARLHGFLAESGTINGEGGYASSPILYNRNPALHPEWVFSDLDFNIVSDQKDIPVGARVFADFSGADVNYLTGSVLGVPAARIGGNVWSDAAYGQQRGAMFANGTSPNANTIPDTQSDGTIVWTKPDNYFPLGVSAVHRYIFRYTDADNHNFLYVDENGTGYVFTRVDGVQTNTGGFTFGTNYTTAKVVLLGDNIKVYNGATLKTELTDDSNLTATRKGWQPNSPLLRLSSMTLI